MSNALVKVDTSKVIGNFTQSELDTIKATIAKGTTNEQFALFIQTCVATGLNPFMNHVHCIVYNGQGGPTMSIQIAVEGILYLARQKEDYRGIDVQLVYEKDEFKMNPRTRKIDHEIGFPRGKLLGGYAVAKREGFDDVIVIMEISEVEHLEKGRNAAMWRDWKPDMFKKHLMKRAAKLQYGIEIAEDEPTSGAESIPEYDPKQRIDVTQNATETPRGDSKKAESDSADIKKRWDEVNEKAEFLGMDHATDEGKKSLLMYINTKLGKKAKDCTAADLIGLLKIMDADLDERNNADGDRMPEFDFEKDE